MGRFSRCAISFGAIILYACMCWVARGWALIHAQMGAYSCMDRCLLVHGWLLINLHGWVLIHVWMGAYVCMNGYLCMNGQVLVHA